MASEYEVIIPPASEHDLDRMPKAAQIGAVELIDALRFDPCPPYAWRLAEQDNIWAFDVWGRRYRVVIRFPQSSEGS